MDCLKTKIFSEIVILINNWILLQKYIPFFLFPDYFDLLKSFLGTDELFLGLRIMIRFIPLLKYSTFQDFNFWNLG